MTVPSDTVRLLESRTCTLYGSPCTWNVPTVGLRRYLAYTIRFPMVT